MNNLKKSLGIVGVALATLGTASAAQAALVVVPPDLAPGAQYRLVFVTDGTTNALSTNINDYNTFVTNQVTGSALATALTAANLTTTWRAIGSTATVAAKANTGTDGSLPDVPIYLINGTRVANNNADLWDGTIIQTINVTQLDSEAAAGTFVWSGTSSDGTTNVSNALGAVFPPYGVLAGVITALDSDWISKSYVPSWVEQRFYGMSSVLTVPTATPPAATVPEPTSVLGYITLGGLMLGGAVRKARK